MYTFIINPNARSGLGSKVWSKLEPELQKQHVNYRVFFTKYQCHATRLVAELTSDGQEHTIVALGGDGTVNEVINGIKDCTKVTLGYIPIGSSNDFARYFHLDSSPEEALKRILSPTGYSYMNLGVVTYQNRRRRFAVSSGIGFDAAICHQAVISRLKIILNRLHLGRLTYVGIALDQIIHSIPGHMKLVLDNNKVLEFEKTFFATAMNHPYEGGGFKFCPDANPCDDVLNTTVIAGLPKWKILLLLPTAYFGWHTHFHGVYTYTCKEVEIESERALPVHTDGEPIFLQRNLHMSLEQEHLKIITS